MRLDSGPAAKVPLHEDSHTVEFFFFGGFGTTALLETLNRLTVRESGEPILWVNSIHIR